MGYFSTKVMQQLEIQTFLGQDTSMPSSKVADKAAELLGLGSGAGMWINGSLYDFLEQRGELDDEGIIAAIITWETQNPDELADAGLRAFGPRDRRLGCVPPAQRKLFAKWLRDSGRCPQCGAPVSD